MELDPQTTAKFTNGLKEANDECASLRQTIVKTQKDLMEMKASGKENSKEYKDLEIALGKYNTQLKNSSAHANKFASALGVNQMSMNQLKAYTKKLRNDTFFRSHWDDIDNLDTGIVDIKCKITDLIAYSLVDHLQ